MLTYNVQILFETDKMRDFWIRQMCLVRDCYNFIAKAAFDEKTPLNIKEYHKRFYKAERKAFPALPAQMCIKVYKNVLANYRTVEAQKKKEELEERRLKKWYEKKGKPFPEEKYKKEEMEERAIEMKHPAVRLDKRLYSKLTTESFKLATGDGKRRAEVRFVRYLKFDEMAAQYKMSDPELKYDEEKDILYACIPFVVPESEPLPETYLGADLGIKRGATLSNGTAIVDNKRMVK